MFLKTKKIGLIIFSLLLAFSPLTIPLANTWAEDESTIGFSMTPLKENVILSPGETYDSSFTIFNPATNPTDFNYDISISPFYVDENYVNTFTTEGDFNQITDWITIKSPLSGTLAPNEQTEIYFSIDTPENAPSGGQYAAIVVSSADVDVNATVVEKTAIAHTIFAEITGTSVHDGEVVETNVPNFIIDGKITASSTIKNTGNVHSKATYTLKVTSTSGEVIYSNESEPASHDILPNRNYHNEITVDNTPGFGIFNVTYTIDYEGVVTEVSKMVVICPIWLMLVIIAFVIILIVGFIFMLSKKKSKKD